MRPLIPLAVAFSLGCSSPEHVSLPGNVPGSTAPSVSESPSPRSLSAPPGVQLYPLSPDLDSSPDSHRLVPPGAYDSSIEDLCTSLAAHLGLTSYSISRLASDPYDYFQPVPDDLPDPPASEPPPAADVSTSTTYTIAWADPLPWPSLQSLLSSAGVAAFIHAGLFYCGPTTIPFHSFSGFSSYTTEFLTSVLDPYPVLRAGDLVFVLGSLGPHQLATLRALSSAPAEWDAVDLPPDHASLVSDWLSSGGFASYVIASSERFLVGPPSVISAVRSLLSTLSTSCAPYVWDIRSPSFDPVAIQDSLSDILCAPPVILPTRVYFTTRDAPALHALLVALDPVSPAIHLVSYLALVDSSWFRSVGFAAGRPAAAAATPDTPDAPAASPPAATLTAVDSSLSFSLPLLDHLADFTLERSSGFLRSLRRVEASTLLGVSVTLTDGATYRRSAGAVVDDSGNTRESVESASYGFNFTATPFPYSPGVFRVDYSLDSSEPLDPDLSSLSELLRSGSVLVAPHAPALLASLSLETSTRASPLLGRRSSSASRSLVLLLELRLP